MHFINQTFYIEDGQLYTFFACLVRDKFMNTQLETFEPPFKCCILTSLHVALYVTHDKC